MDNNQAILSQIGEQVVRLYELETLYKINFNRLLNEVTLLDDEQGGGLEMMVELDNLDSEMCAANSLLSANLYKQQSIQQYEQLLAQVDLYLASLQTKVKIDADPIIQMSPVDPVMVGIAEQYLKYLEYKRQHKVHYEALGLEVVRLNQADRDDHPEINALIQQHIKNMHQAGDQARAIFLEVKPVIRQCLESNLDLNDLAELA